MRKASIELSLFNFHLNMNEDIDLLMKIETTKRVVKTFAEKQNIFEAFVLSICVNWEVLVEELLIDCFNRDTSKYCDYTGFILPKHVSKEMCKAILIGMNYLDFKSVDHLKQMSSKILVPDYNPFLKIPSVNAKRIDDFFIIRNYLAHRSYQSKRSLFNIYRNHYELKTFIEPGRFLLAKDPKFGIPRMGVFINVFKKCAEIMGSFLGLEDSKATFLCE